MANVSPTMAGVTIGAVIASVILFTALGADIGGPSHEEALAELRAKEAQAAAEKAASDAQIREEAPRIISDGDQAFLEKDYETARNWYQQVYDVAPETPGLKEKMEKAGRRLAEQQEREEASRAMEARKGIEASLRELFLDQGLDIKVDVSGKSSDRLTLTFALFNDVWNHRFDKEGLIDQWCGMGFKKITLRDGYDWGKIWTCGG